MFLNPNKPQFATNFLMVERLFKLRPTIEQIIADVDWTTFNTLRGTRCHKSFTKAKVIQPYLKRDRFWDTCANFVHMVEPILVSLRAFNGKQPCMGRAWIFIKTLE
jgi:hypothetical protein